MGRNGDQEPGEISNNKPQCVVQWGTKQELAV